MKPTWGARLAVWLVAAAAGGFGWWLVSGVLAEISDIPEMSYLQAFAAQMGVQLAVHALLVALAAFMDASD